jgi:hypothetical protein
MQSQGIVQGTGLPASTTVCYNEVSTAANNLSWAEYDITLPFEDAIPGVIDNAHIAQEALASTACAGLESYIGADVATAQSEIVPALQSVTQGQRTAASDHFGRAADSAQNAGYTLFFLLHPRF